MRRSRRRARAGLVTAGDDQDPVWSPDGKWIAFVSNRDGEYKLFKMRADGSRPTKIVDITIGAGSSRIDWGSRP